MKKKIPAIILTILLVSSVYLLGKKEGRSELTIYKDYYYHTEVWLDEIYEDYPTLMDTSTGGDAFYYYQLSVKEIENLHK